MNNKIPQYLDLDNLELYYWAGFLAADGYITKDKKVILTISTKDLDHLKKYAKFLNKNNILIYNRKTKHSPYCRLNFNNLNFANLLETKFNIVNKKSLTYKAPVIDDFIKRLCFLIGYIDGDGCVSYEKEKYLFISIRGTLSMLDFCEKVFNEIVPENGYRKNKSKYTTKQIHNTFKVKGYRANLFIDKIQKLNLPIPMMNRKILNKIPNLKDTSIKTKEQIEKMKKTKTGVPNLKLRKRIIDNFGNIYNSITEASILLDLNISKITLVCQGKRNHTGGYKFKYLD